MKLIMAVVQDHVVNDVLEQLSNNSIRATKLSSTGGFFKEGNTTVLLAVEDDKLKETKEMILNISKTKEKVDEKTANMDNLIRM